MRILSSRLLLVGALLLAVGAIGLLASRDGTRATSFEPTGDLAVADPSAGANSDITFELSLDAPDAIFSAVIGFIPPAWGIVECPVNDPAAASAACADDAVPDGTMVGKVESDTVLGLLNSACSNQLDLTFNLMDATTDMSTQVVYHDTDDNDAGEMYEDDDANGVPNGAEMYPDFVARLVRNIPFGLEGSEPVQPIARWYSQIQVASDVDNTSVQFVVLEPGTMVNSLPLDESLGFPVVLVLNDLGDPLKVAQPGQPITGFCSPITSVQTVFGTSEDNPDTVDNEAGMTLLTNPGDGEYWLTLFIASEYDADGDGIENPEDQCPTQGTTPGWDPRIVNSPGDNDHDGIPNICDPTPDQNVGPFDQDGDQFLNNQDVCPTIVDPEQRDSDRDDIGDFCDPDPASPTGHQHMACLVASVDIGDGAGPVGAPPPLIVPPCVLDQPVPFGDVDCSGAVEALDALATLKFVANQQPAPDCIDLADVQCDADKDSLDALQILRFIAGLDVVQTQPCPLIESFV